MLLIHRPGKKYIICISYKTLIKIQQPWIKVLKRTYWNISRSIKAKYMQKEAEQMLIIHKIHHIKSFIILVISDTRIALFDAKCIFSISSTEANSVSL